jgi:hypothetical protein
MASALPMNKRDFRSEVNAGRAKQQVPPLRFAPVGMTNSFVSLKQTKSSECVRELPFPARSPQVAPQNGYKIRL